MKNILLGIILLLIVSCKTQQVSITNTEWRLVKMQDEELTSLNPPITLLLNETEKKVSGFAGCNRFFGSYLSENSTIRFSGLGSTKMFCQDKSAVEDTYFKSLGEIQSFKLERDKLFLLKGGQVLLEFKK